MSDQSVYWNKVADKKYFTTPFRMDLFSKYADNHAEILDYGCGYGRTLTELKNHRFDHLHGVDFSEKMIRRAERDSTSSMDLKVIVSGKLPFTDRSFDAVLLLAVLTCVWQDREQDAILQEIKRVLKPGGIIYINDFLLNRDERNLERYNRYVSEYGTYGVFELPDGAVLRHHTEKRVDEWTRGFEKLECERSQYTTMNGHYSNGLVYIGRWK